MGDGGEFAGGTKEITEGEWAGWRNWGSDAFEDMTGRERREEMLIPLHDGQPIRFGADGHRGVVMGSDGQLRIVEVADVGEDAILVHDAGRDDPSLATALARLSTDDHSPTPIGIFRAVERQDYGTAIARQLMAASEGKGSPDLAALLRSNGTWSVS